MKRTRAISSGNPVVERRARTRLFERRMKAGVVDNPCVTRGVSYTRFPQNTSGKAVLDRCGRPPREDKRVESFDETREFINYQHMMRDNKGVL